MKIAPIIANCLAIVALSNRFDLDEEPLQLPLKENDGHDLVYDAYTGYNFKVRTF